MKAGTNKIFKCSRFKSHASTEQADKSQADLSSSSATAAADHKRQMSKENIAQSTTSRKFSLKKAGMSDEEEEDEEICRIDKSAQKMFVDKLNITDHDAKQLAVSSLKPPPPPSITLTHAPASISRARSTHEVSASSSQSDKPAASKRKSPSQFVKPMGLEYEFEEEEESSGQDLMVTVFEKKKVSPARQQQHESMLLDGDETIVADSGRCFTSLVAMSSKNFYSSSSSSCKKAKSDGALVTQKLTVDLAAITETAYRSKSGSSAKSSSSSSSSPTSSSSSNFYSAVSSSCSSTSSASTSPLDVKKKLSEDFERQVGVSSQATTTTTTSQVKKFTLKTSSDSTTATAAQVVAPARMPRLPKLSRAAAAAATAAKLQQKDSSQKPFYDFDATMSAADAQKTTQPFDQNGSASMIMLCNSRKAYECEELGETQAFADDLYYLMDGLGSEFSTGQRCLSAIKFAEHCLSSDFRMHLRSYHGTLAKIFGLLSDCTKEPSLALCTSCIMYALSRDKLAMEIDKTMLKLIVEIAKIPAPVNNDEAFSTPVSASVSTESLSSDSFKRTKPTIFASRMAAKTKAMARAESGESPEELYAKALKQCKSFCQKLLVTQAAVAQTSPKSASKQAKKDKTEQSPACQEPVLTVSQFDLSLSELSAQQLAIECLLHLTVNKKASGWLMDELLSLGALEIVVDTLRSVITRLAASSGKNSSSESRRPAKKSSSKTKQATTPEPRGGGDDDEFNLICKYTRCINLLESLTQTTQFGCSQAKLLQQPGDEASLPAQGASDLTLFGSSSSSPLTSYRVHSHLIGLKIIQICQDSLELYFGELVALHTTPVKAGKSPSSQTPRAGLDAQKCAFKRQIVTQALKATFLLYLNLTNADISCAKELIEEEKMMELMLVFLRDIVQHIPDVAEQFDITVLGLITLINLLVIDYNMRRLPGHRLGCPRNGTNYMLKDVEFELTKTKSNSFEIIWNLYLNKQGYLDLAESDQSSQILELTEQLKSKNQENINSALVDSLGKAEKHMEAHIVAAHSAIIIAYLLKNMAESGQKPASREVDAASLKSELPGGSFLNLVEVIDKYMSFMDVLNVSGLSACEHLKELLDFLKKL